MVEALVMGTVGALILPAFTYSRTKRTSPLQTPCIPQSLRDLLRFACQMQSALADIFLLHLVTSSRSVFALLEHYGVISYKVKKSSHGSAELVIFEFCYEDLRYCSGVDNESVHNMRRERMHPE